MDPIRSGWREPMLWLVFGLPLAAVIGGIGLVVVSVRGGSNDAVIDQVQRTGQMQTADLGPDARAATLRLGAVLQSDGGQLHVFAAGGNFHRGESLQLTLLHPQHQATDQVIQMRPDGTGWHATLELDGSHDWIVHLADQDGSWRLRGRLPKDQRATHLGPSLEVQ